MDASESKATKRALPLIAAVKLPAFPGTYARALAAGSVRTTAAAARATTRMNEL
ncbi:MAG TPA: hypothetical protein VLB89_01525 [Gaiellaceae bacterium]|nr:hypothetical protein [Gaiellaceae bacterium]